MVACLKKPRIYDDIDHLAVKMEREKLQIRQLLEETQRMAGTLHVCGKRRHCDIRLP